MPAPHLHVVSLDVPSPPDYGGAIDIFYKVKALSALGVRVHLHCYTYGREDISPLEKLCEAVHLYPRKTGLLSNVSRLPYITFSRRSDQLLAHLLADDHPILFEGLHTVYPLLGPALKGRAVVVRAHNVEHDYYRQLGKKTANLLKKLFFFKEAYLLGRLLNRLPEELVFGAISPADQRYLARRFPKTFWLPPFHAHEAVLPEMGSGEYALYHGNLSVAENSEIADALITAFGGQSIPLIVAGKDPAPAMVAAAARYENIQLIANPTAEKMQELIRAAHAILLLTNQATGIKLKLIESLFQGRFCLANAPMVDGTKLEHLVELVTMDGLYASVEQVMRRTFTKAEKEQRSTMLNNHYHNETNATLLARHLGMLDQTSPFKK